FAVGAGADGKPDTYILPISGKGLWSTIKGYMALEGDFNHVRGVTFYEHGETPGLGGECENPAWCAQWKGKTILDEQGHLVGVGVKKGKVDPAVAAEKAHKVDGLSGSTLTSNGITRFVKSDLDAFAKYLTSLRTK
ncbi:MAG: NADH:ubiquinone reductase (Na(+)-transporting) subunit C, partial [Planctomycetes bacterium]|nr:NADH:ubiquinone reductase (Na(+)-transporting) subunit C [Planctomycetota bacterium]